MKRAKEGRAKKRRSTQVDAVAKSSRIIKVPYHLTRRDLNNENNNRDSERREVGWRRRSCSLCAFELDISPRWASDAGTLLRNVLTQQVSQAQDRHCRLVELSVEHHFTHSDDRGTVVS